jgi:Arc/MetJ-type ribon-helix-helix transcriptional regulator
MADRSRSLRVQRLRNLRRERGDREMNVWVSKPAGDAIDEAVEDGRFRSRQEAIAYALEAVFIRKERNAVT